MSGLRTADVVVLNPWPLRTPPLRSSASNAGGFQPNCSSGFRSRSERLRRLDSVKNLTQKHRRNRTQPARLYRTLDDLFLIQLKVLNGFLSNPEWLKRFILIRHLCYLALSTNLHKSSSQIYFRIPQSELSS